MTTTAHQSTLRGVLTIDGKEQQIAARDLQFRPSSNAHPLKVPVDRSRWGCA